MSVKAAIALSLVGAASAVLTDYVLRNRPRHIRYLAGSTAFLLPFGVYALALSTGQQTTFLFISDTHGAASSNSKLVQNLSAETGVNFVVHGGDIADNDSLWGAWWDTPFGSLISQYPIYAVSGNHDPETGFRQRFPTTLPYKVSAGSADLFLLPWSITAATATWLDQQTSASTAKFRILVAHRPVWAANSGQSTLPTLLAASLPRLDLILAGHNHVYWDSLHTVGNKQVRQIIVKSGPKNYACDAGVSGCVENLTTYLRIDATSSSLNVTRRVVQ